jgi:hypothetical protein
MRKAPFLLGRVGCQRGLIDRKVLALSVMALQADIQSRR